MCIYVYAYTSEFIIQLVTEEPDRVRGENAQHLLGAILGLVGEALACDHHINLIVGQCCLGVPGVLLRHVNHASARQPWAPIAGLSYKYLLMLSSFMRYLDRTNLS